MIYETTLSKVQLTGAEVYKIKRYICPSVNEFGFTPITSSLLFEAKGNDILVTGTDAVQLSQLKLYRGARTEPILMLLDLKTFLSAAKKSGDAVKAGSETALTFMQPDISEEQEREKENFRGIFQELLNNNPCLHGRIAQKKNLLETLRGLKDDNINLEKILPECDKPVWVDRNRLIGVMIKTPSPYFTISTTEPLSPIRIDSKDLTHLLMPVKD